MSPSKTHSIIPRELCAKKIMKIMNRQTAKTRLKMEQTTEASTMTDRPVARQMQRMPQTKTKSQTHKQMLQQPMQHCTTKMRKKWKKMACGDWNIMTANILFPTNLAKYYLSLMHSSTYKHMYICRHIVYAHFSFPMVAIKCG